MFHHITRSGSHTRTAALAAITLALATVIAGCSGPSSDLTGPATVAAPTTVTVPTTVTATHLVTDTSTVTATTTETSTHVLSTTVTPEPAGTTTLVHTTTRVHTAVKTVTAPPPKPKVAFGDGTYVVGKDVAPGIYQASIPNPADDLCYWETDSRDGEIIDNGVNNGIVHIGSSVFSVRVQDCGDWTKIG